LPMFPAKPPQFDRKAWPVCMRAALGVQGLAFVEALLVWDPSKRGRLSSETLEHSYLKPERFSLGGWALNPTSGGFELVAASSFEGQRHRWNVLQGEMAAEVPRFLQEDPALMPYSDEHAALQLGFSAQRTCEHGGGQEMHHRGVPWHLRHKSELRLAHG
jgi:hypothetical protein